MGCDAGDPKAIKATVEIIREALNPHPAGQKTLNAPKKAELTGVQHKYAETVLFFAAAAQTCHAYCTYCFRWAQFIGDADLRFAQKDADSLFDYLEEHEEVSDILFTGGKPVHVLHARESGSCWSAGGPGDRGLRLEILTVPRRRVDREGVFCQVRPQGDLVRRLGTAARHVAALGGGRFT